jgi:hypothetical protein
VKQSEDFSKIFHRRQKYSRQQGKRRWIFPKSCGKNPIIPQEIDDLQKNRKKPGKAQENACFSRFSLL